MTGALHALRVLLGAGLAIAAVGYFMPFLVPFVPAPAWDDPMAARLMTAFDRSGLLAVARFIHLVAGVLLLTNRAVPFALAAVMPVNLCGLFISLFIEAEPFIAVLFGAASQFDFLFPFQIWDWQSWYRLVEGQEQRIVGAGRAAQVLAIATGAVAIVLLGMLSGIAVTFAREYGFRLDRTPKGFRCRRGLFNKTDVTLPAHRVQAAKVQTRLIRSRFGWHSLEFVSLAQDVGGSSHHAVVPFGKLGEIWPVARAAGIEPPPEGLEWRRPSSVPWRDDAVLHILFFAVLGIASWIATGRPWGMAVAGLLMAGTAFVYRLAWRRHFHAEDGGQLFVRMGTLMPRLTIAPQVKLQSAEIVQGPLARKRGHATLHLGLAGDRLSIPGLPLAEARALRAVIIQQVAAVDFSRLPR